MKRVLLYFQQFGLKIILNLLRRSGLLKFIP